MTTITMPEIGSKIVAVNVPGIYHANNRICTVIEYSDANTSVHASFDAYEDSNGNHHPATTWFLDSWIAVGDRVIADDIPSYQHLAGQEVTVTAIHNGSGDKPYYTAMFSDGSAHSAMSLAFYSATKAIPRVEKRVGASNIVIPADANMIGLEAIIEALSNDLAEINTKADLRHDRIQELETVVSQAHRAVEIIGERLISESNDRGWCSEFDRIIEEVNQDLPGPFALPTRYKEYEVTWTETYTVTVDRSVTYTAASEEEAIQEAKNEAAVDRSEVIDAIRSGAYDFDTDDNYEASEV